MNIRNPYRRCVMTAGVLLLIAGASGCRKDQEAVLYFSHYLHVEEFSMSCAECHGKEQDGRFVRPSHTTCADCHDDWIETKKISEDTCGQCHKFRDLDALAALTAPEPARGESAAFVHTAALQNRCADCHGSLMDQKITQVPKMARSDRVRTREKAHRWGMDCASCHVDMDRDTAPANHDINWMRRHGNLGMEPDNACGVCHAQQSCRECHQTMMPASHNNLWRRKTHGIQAAWDRERCMVCHQPDSCNACHAEVKPDSHNATWRRTHCNQCHASSATGTGCAFCHPGGLAAHPDPHELNWRSTHCNNCHAGSTVQGVSCAACHGGNLLANHPNPHPAAYARTHCGSCHASATLQGARCTSCHGANLMANHPNPHPAHFERTHCNSCHLGATVQGVSCAACHGRFISNHPNPHPANFRKSHCNSCHSGGPGGKQCGLCHQGGNSVLVHQDFWPPVHDLFGDKANCFDCHL